jgi:cation diffusion facilitator family transporter
VPIQFDSALVVAVVGLVVNGASALLLGHGHDHGHDHEHDHAHEHHDHDHDHDDHDHDHHDHHHHDDHHHDHNLRAAYLHVLADAMTSVLAIAALLAGKFAGWSWLDPVMGIVGAGLVAHWSWGLLKASGNVLLDRQAPAETLEDVRKSLESGGERVVDLHVWSIGPGLHAAEAVISAKEPLAASAYRARLPRSANIVHAVIEVNASR